MPYYDEATFRRALGSDRVTGYFATSEELDEAIEMAEDRVYAAIQAAGHKDKSPSSYATVASVPAVIRRACYVALLEEAYARVGLVPSDYLTDDQRGIFERLRDGMIEIPGSGNEVDTTARAVGGVDYTENGVSDTSSSRSYARVFGRSQFKGNW